MEADGWDLDNTIDEAEEGEGDDGAAAEDGFFR